MAKKIYVGNLSFQTSESGLSDYFAQHGEVHSVTIVMDRDTGRSRGFGFVEMPNDDEARAAIAALDGVELEDRALNINEARPREPRDNRGPRRY